MPAHRPTLILFCGLPGSGKTTLACALEAAGRGIRLCTDEWQAALGTESVVDDLHGRLQAQLYAHALTLLRAGHDVILEDGLWTAPERAQKRADAAACGAHTELHYFNLPLEVLWQRLQQRNHAARLGDMPVSRSELEHYWDLFQRPSPDELALFDAVTTHSA